jgi:transposase
MAKAYSDDLRRRFLSAYEQGEGTLEELAERFMVSLAWGNKMRRQLLRNQQMERVEQRRGTPRKLLAESREHLRRALAATPDLTLVQLQQQIQAKHGVSISQVQVFRVLKQMGIRLKKSHSTPPSGTRKRTASGGKSSFSTSARSRRRS